jgi:hypothetical protein
VQRLTVRGCMCSSRSLNYSAYEELRGSDLAKKNGPRHAKEKMLL